LQAIASATLVKTPESLTIAIAALTGRRFAEVVSVGKFELTEHPYQLLFSGQQKKQNPEPYLIFTLIPAQEVWSLIQEYRTLPLIESLSGLDDEHPLMGNLNDRVNRDVHNLLGNTGIVPIPQGYKTISIHRLRGLYGRIIVHYFCPPDQHEHRFIQRYLGHVFASDESDRPNARATEHYFHYNLLADNNQLLLEKGVKLHPMSSSASNSGSQTDKPITSLNSQPTINITLQLPEAIAQQQWQSILNSAFSQGASAVKLLENLELANPNWGISQALGFLSQEVSTLRQQVAALTLENQKLPEPSENIDNEALKAKQEKLKLEYASLKQENQELLREISLLKEKNAKMVQMYQNIVAAFASPSEKPELLPETAVDPSLPGRVEFSSKPEERSQQSSDEREDEFKAKEPAKRSRKASLLPENVERHINAIIDWNKAHPTSAYAITEGLLTKFFNLNRELVLEYLQERDLTEYHASIGVTDANKRGFNRQKDRVALKDDIVEFVKAKVKES
jgi:regulator of replication initiation timing